MKLFALTLGLFPLIACATAHVDAKPYPEAGRGNARYEVPTNDATLAPYAMYPIKDVTTVEKNDKVTIRYSLPLELTGVANKIELTSTNQATNGTYTNFKGTNGEANCDAESCNVRYHGLKLDADAARALLVGKGITGLELDKRMQLVASFSGDPAGIIHFDQSALK